MKKYIADKQFYKTIIVIVIPIVLQQLVQVSVVFVDNYMVAGLGEEAVAGVAIANQYYQLFFPLLSAVGAGSAVFIAQYYGGKEYDKLRTTFGLAIVTLFVISVLYTVVGYVLDDQLIHFFNTENTAAMNYAKDYLRIILLSYIPFAITMAYTFMFRPIGKARIPMIVSSVALILNLVLNYGLIYGRLGFPELGVRGAAIGTVAARIVETILFVIMFNEIDLSFKSKLKDYLGFTKEFLLNFFRKTGILFINDLLFSSSLILIFKAYSTRGIIAISAYNVAQIILRYILIFTNGTGTSSSILVGKNLGAGKYKEAESNANYILGYVMMMGLVVTAILFVLSAFIPNIYTAFEMETRQLLRWMIVVLACTVPLQVFTRVPYFVMRAGGRVREILLLDGVFMWAVKVPLAFYLAYFTELEIIWMLVIIESTRVLNAIVSMSLFKQKKWLQKIG